MRIVKKLKKSRQEGREREKREREERERRERRDKKERRKKRERREKERRERRERSCSTSLPLYWASPFLSCKKSHTEMVDKPRPIEQRLSMKMTDKNL